MRAEIATEAGRLAGRSHDQTVELVRRVLAHHGPVFLALEQAGLPGDAIVGAGSAVTGLPPAPRLLLRQPVIPVEIDAMGIRDAGGTPIGVVQGRLWVAFSDPEAARAAIFSDDVVVCLATNPDLEEARARFRRAHPFSATAATVALTAVTNADLQAFAREQLARRPAPPASDDGPPPSSLQTVTTTPLRTVSPRGDGTAPTGSDESAFDEATEHLARPVEAPQTTVVTPARRTLTDAPGPDDVERARLARAAQLGRLKRFRFDRQLGSGGMASVYLAVDREQPGPPLAVKLLLPHLQDNALAVGRFRREVRALMALNHPHIVPLIDGDAEADGGVLWLACRYLDGGTLRDLLRSTGPLPLVAALPLVVALLEAQAHAHAAGVVHRDLKPQNILLGTDGSICIADFGVAAAVGEEPLTVAGARFGTPAYMAPEQALGQPVDARADLFATGAIFHELLSGKNPFVRASPAETMRAVARGEVTAPGIPLPPAVQSVLAALLAVPRDARPPDAEAALRALRPACAECPPVDEVVRRLLADPQAWRGQTAPQPRDTTTNFLFGETREIASIAAGFDDVDAPAAPRSGQALRAVQEDPHSAFGDVVGARATMELAAIPLAERPSLAPPTSPPTPTAPSVEARRSRAAASTLVFVVAGVLFIAGVIAAMVWALSD